MRLVRVAVPVPSLDLLAYIVPAGLQLPPVGARVLVPLGTRQVTGCIVQAEEEQVAAGGGRQAPGSLESEAGPVQGMTDEPGLRELLDLIDEEPFLPGDVVDLAMWVAEYYASGPGEALAAATPPKAWIESERVVQISEAGLVLYRGLAGVAASGTGEVQQAGETAPAPGILANAGAPSAWSAGSRTAEALGLLAHGRTVPVHLLGRRLSRGQSRTTAVHALVRALEREGLVRTSLALRGQASAFKTSRVASISVVGLEVLASAGDPASRAAAGDEARSPGEPLPAGSSGTRPSEQPPIGPRQREALSALAGSPDGLPLAALRDRGIATDTVRRLAARGLVSLRAVRVERDPFADGGGAGTSAFESPLGKAREEGLSDGDRLGTGRTVPEREESGISRCDPRALTQEQERALESLNRLADARAFKVALLHGVTGSGKTEVYLRLAARVVSRGRSVLVLVPEIALTPSLASQFRALFGDAVAVQHSGLSDGERYDQWHRIRRGEISVVVGTRSAVFAPLANLGLLVVDEEHDGSYKQDESPRYNGRDVAVMRAKRQGALAVLGSATPSVESYQHARNGHYELVRLERRVFDRPLAAVRVVDMREEYASQGPDVLFSETLRLAIEERLARREQVLVLLNRRGFATAVFCRQCGNTLECPNCSVSLTVHGRDRRRARCHYCNYSMNVPKTCQSCAAPYLEQVGVGTERLEEEALKLFPGARVARLDRDVATRRGAMASLLARFGAGEIDLLIGTQMIAKGHDFPRVTLVGVISADVGLGLPDFRAGERTFQLLTQVVGRAGRGERRGEAIIQTLHPDHYSVRLACRQDYQGFFEEELRFRRSMRYPPEVALVNAIVRGPTFQAAMEDAADLVHLVRATAEGAFRVLGPAPAPFVKLRGEHRAQFFVKGTRRTAMRQAVQRAVAERPDLRRRVTIDVDPLSVL